MYSLFPPKGGGNGNLGNFPFKIFVENALSGISKSHFDSKCPCDTGHDRYTSRYMFKKKSEYPIVSSSGMASFKVYSGSNLFTQFKADGLDPQRRRKTSYQGDANQTISENNCEKIFKEGSMTVFGLNRNVFIKDFFGADATTSDTLKIWLTVCFPMGDAELAKDSMQDFETTDPDSLSCHDCGQRANIPMTAFISCATGDWPTLIHSDLVNKATGSPNPRLEKRQIAARVPIGEIDISGRVVAQYLNSNLTLTDMCLQGIPCKYPLSTFSENYR